MTRIRLILSLTYLAVVTQQQITSKWLAGTIGKQLMLEGADTPERSTTDNTQSFTCYILTGIFYN